MYLLTSTGRTLMRRVMPSSILETQPESFLFKLAKGTLVELLSYSERKATKTSSYY